MDFDRMLMGALFAFSLVVACSFVCQRWRWRRNKRLGRRLGFYPRMGAMGNALQQLQTIAEPQMEHVLAEKLDEEVDEDAEGGPEDPTAHLLRQARRIRRGERLERLTVLWRGRG